MPCESSFDSPVDAMKRSTAVGFPMTASPSPSADQFDLVVHLRLSSPRSSPGPDVNHSTDSRCGERRVTGPARRHPVGRTERHDMCVRPGSIAGVELLRLDAAALQEVVLLRCRPLADLGGDLGLPLRRLRRPSCVDDADAEHRGQRPRSVSTWFRRRPVPRRTPRRSRRHDRTRRPGRSTHIEALRPLHLDGEVDDLRLRPGRRRTWPTRSGCDHGPASALGRARAVQRSRCSHRVVLAPIVARCPRRTSL